MNPEKYSEHTALNHSILWRKSYTFEKPQPYQSEQCHKQLNPCNFIILIQWHKQESAGELVTT